MAISLTCALLATLLHQWARRYIKITQPIRCSPHKRARSRAFFAEGVDALHVQWAIEALPILLHVSLFLFFAGLLVFLFNINQTAFSAVVVWVAFSAGVYTYITLMPIFRYDSPYYAPLSSTAWFLYAGTLFVIFKVLCFIPRRRDTPEPFRDQKDRYREWALGGVEKAAMDTASERSSVVDVRVLDWTTGALSSDDALERFFEAIPGFCDSKEVSVRVPSQLGMKIRQVMDGFLDRTFTSELISESTKLRRLTICLNASNAALGSFAVSRILGNIFDGRWREAPQSIELGHSIRRWCLSSDEWVALTARSLVASIIAAQERNDRWIALVKDQFGLPDRILRDNIRYGDSVLLVILLHVINNLFHAVLPPWDSNILRVLSRFDILNTLPHLQHEFCTLWNEIVQDAQNRRPYSTPLFILREVRHLYAALHGDTYFPPNGTSASPTTSNDTVWQPSSYPLCNVVSHHSSPMPHVHGTIVEQSTRASVVSSPAVLHFDPTLAPSPSSPTRLDIPSIPAPHRRHSRQLPAEPPAGDVAHAPPRFFIDTTPPLSVSTQSQSAPTASPEIVAAPATPGNIDISTAPLLTDPIPQSGDDPASPRSEEPTIVPSPVVSDATPTPILTSTLSSEAIPVEPPSTSESPLHLAPQVTSVSDPPVTPSIGTEDTQHDTGGLGSPTPTQMEISPHPPQSTSADPGTSASTSQAEDRQLDSDQS